MKISIIRDIRNKKRPWVCRWFGEYDPAKGKQRRYSKSFSRKTDAEHWAAQKSVGFMHGEPLDDSKETLESFCKKWKRLRTTLRPETQKLYGYTIERLLNYFGPEMLLRKITADQAAAFIAEIKPLREKPNISDWTKHRTLRNCKTMFKQASKTTGFNPFDEIGLSMPDASDFHYLTPEEYGRLLNSASALRQQCLYALCYTGGCRFSEAVSRQWCDLNLETGDLNITSSEATAQHPEFILKGKKGKRYPRIVTLPPQTMNLLRKLRIQNIDTPYIFFDGVNYEKLKKRWTACSKEHKSWRWQGAYLNVNRDLNRNAAKAKIEIRPGEKFSIHTLRKCAGKNWATMNHDPKVTGGLMGHRNYQTTMKFYAKVTAEDRASAAAKIEAMLKVG